MNFFLLFNEPRLFFYLTTIIEFKVIFFFSVQGRNKCLIKRGNWQTITIEMWSVKKNKLVSPLKPDLCIFSRQNYFLFPWPPRNITKDDLNLPINHFTFRPYVLWTETKTSEIIPTKTAPVRSLRKLGAPHAIHAWNFCIRVSLQS